MNDVDNPLEPFKRATTAAIRAIAENDELDVNFGPGAPTAQGDRVRLPLPSQGASAAEIDAVRGIGDEYALLVLRRSRNAIGEAGSVNERRIIVFHIVPFEKGIDLRTE